METATVSRPLCLPKDAQRILVLEDDANRVGVFRKLLIGRDVVYTEHAVDAIAALMTTVFDLILLDHDLGGQVFVDSEEDDTGYQVAKVVPDSINKDTTCIVHSLNFMGADLMVACSPKTMSYIPFPTLVTQWHDLVWNEELAS